VGIFNGFEVLDRSIFGVTSYLAGMKVPTKDSVPEQIEHRLIVHDFSRGDQGGQNDTLFAHHPTT
jgi:hypothetical protein